MKLKVYKYDLKNEKLTMEGACDEILSAGHDLLARLPRILKSYPNGSGTRFPIEFRGELFYFIIYK